jgi:hypothetical protein
MDEYDMAVGAGTGYSEYSIPIFLSPIGFILVSDGQLLPVSLIAA